MFIADLHIHSRYSRATSGNCVPEALELAARRKGLQVLASGDFTHPAWRQDLREALIPAEQGLYRLRDEKRLGDSHLACDQEQPRFIISGELSSIYKKNGRVRKVHNLVLLPSLEAAETLSARLEALGCNLRADGRPIMGLDSRDVLELTLDICPQAIFIPAHIWTPHFSALGAYSGFYSIAECFEDLTPYIHAVETGLSSDPPMNWRLSQLDAFHLISNSDAHSPAKLAREANLFSCELSYDAIAQALVKGQPGLEGTIEFFPEEGKYHYDGHRNCGVCLSPAQTKQAGGICPVCGGRITVGVLHRAAALADRPEGYRPASALPYQSLAPLNEVIATCSGLTTASKKVAAQYEELLGRLGPELYILRQAPLADIEQVGGVCLAEGLRRLRQGEVRLSPGYDGAYGKVGILDAGEIAELSGQLSLFIGAAGAADEPAAPTMAPLTASGAADSVATAAIAEAACPYGLDEQQWAAASATEQAVAVLAGPGSGKTRTLISRILWLLEQQHILAQQIIAVTFTNKAARELRQRLSRQISDKKQLRALRVGTFHSLCREQLLAAGRHFTLLDNYQAEGLAAEVIDKLQLSISPRELLSALSKIKSGLRPAGELEAALLHYQQLLQQYQAYDFDDLLLQTLALYQDGQRPPAGPWLLVDEFQDINSLQYQLIRAWCGEDGRLFVIGDPDQAIYGFRGSDSRCFQRLQADYPQLAQLSLERNYRSTAHITAAAAALLSRPAPPPCREPGDKVTLLQPESALSEGIFIAQEIDRLVGGVDMLSAHRGGKKTTAACGLADIAILCRTHRQTEMIGQCLDHQGIPYILSGRDDFLSQPETRRCCAFLRLLAEPGERLSRHLLEQQLPAAQLEALLEQYRPRWRSIAPAELVRAWCDSLYLSGNAALEQLYNMAQLHQRLPELLAALNSPQEGDISLCGPTYSQDAVALLTLHAAKGLEFPVVFLAGLREGLLPFAAANETELAEEQRLLYVGMTRAGQRLLLLGGQPQSRFWPLLPAEHTENGDALPRRRIPVKQLSLFD